MFNSERYPLNLCLVKNKLDIHVLFLKMENLNLWFLYNGDLRISGFRDNEEIIRIDLLFRPYY